jgi:glycosyltransferase involved in cell wall biosynthesis
MKKRILYLHQYYHTPAEGGGVRSYHIAQALAAQGHNVHVITTWGGSVKRVMQQGNLRITHLPIPYSNNMTKPERIRAFWAFIWQSYKEARAWLPADKVFATSTPLTIGIVALLLKYVHGVPYVFEVRDNWPEAPIQLGYVKGGLYTSLLRGLEKWIYSQADSVIALSPPMAQHVAARAPETDVHMVPNFADTSFFYTETAPTSASPFHVVYAGTMGHANQIQRLLELAVAAKEAKLPVRFTLAGDGADHDQATSFVQQNNLADTVSITPHLSTFGVKDLLATAHSAYVGFRPEPILESNSPNKFFDALAARVPVLLGVSGWLANEVRQVHSGVVMADYPSDLDALQTLMRQDPVALQQGCAKLASRYSKDMLVQHVLDVLLPKPPALVA